MVSVSKSWSQHQNHGLSIKILSFRFPTQTLVAITWCTLWASCYTMCHDIQHRILDFHDSWQNFALLEDYQSVIETVWCEIYNYAHLLSCIFPLQHSISDYICICENEWEGENCQTAAIVTAAANVGGNNTGAAVTGGVVVVIFLLLLLIVIAIVIAVLIFYKRKSKCIGGVHTTSTFARSTPMWSTLTISTFHEINHYKINLSWLQELSWFCKSWFWSYSGWFHVGVDLAKVDLGHTIYLHLCCYSEAFPTSTPLLQILYALLTAGIHNLSLPQSQTLSPIFEARARAWELEQRGKV